MSKFWNPILPPFKNHKKKVYRQIIKTGEFIYQAGESPILRQPSRKVKPEEITSVIFREKLGYLKQCLLKYRKLTGMGKGIAAVQVGIPEKLAVIYMPEAKEGFLVVINPKITKKSQKLYRYPEMCMSLTPVIANVVRPAWIEFEYYDENGKKRYWDRKDNTKKGRSYNRVLQHEIDHLNGILMVDGVIPKEIVLESDPNWKKEAKYEEV